MERTLRSAIVCAHPSFVIPIYLILIRSDPGFVKIALQTGASLVPTWGFGENNLYENLAAGSTRTLRFVCWYFARSASF